MRFKKILLIDPHDVEQGGYTPSPLGLLYLASYLRREPKIKVHFVDGALLGKTAVINALMKFKPDLVGISALTPGRHQAVATARLAKKINPRIKTILGGVHPTIMWKQMLEHYSEVDYIAGGEGEEILWELVHGLGLTEIKGLSWKNKAGKVIANPDRLPIRDLDSLPFPAWDLIDPNAYPPRGEGVYNGIDLTKETRYSIIFSRGCMACCTFCSSWKIWEGYRHRSGINVADEMELLVKKYGAKHFAFYDDTLTGAREEIVTFCKEVVKRKLKVALHGTTRVDKVDKELLHWMKKAGFYEIAYGIESGSPAMLIKINKKTDIDKIFEAAKLTKKAGIRFHALMMYGLPHETAEDRRLSDKLVDRLKPDGIGTVGTVWVFPGTALYIQAKNAGLIDDSFWLGKKPYYIYRGGIGGDKINRFMQIGDEVMYRAKDTVFERPLEYIVNKSKRVTKKINFPAAN